MSKDNELKPWIVTCGASGRCVVFGWSADEPQVGVPHKLLQAKMILRWAGSGGLFGVAANGPDKGSCITAAAPSTTNTPVQVLSVTAEAAVMMDEWPAC